jgi:hypothetical protein
MFPPTGTEKMPNGDRPIYTVLGWIQRLDPDSSDTTSLGRSCDRLLVSHRTDLSRAATSADPEWGPVTP